MEVREQVRPVCVLALRAGREEICPGETCPLWEHGACALERMTAEAELSGDRWPEEDS